MEQALPTAPEFPAGLVWFNTDTPLALGEALRGRVVVLDFWTYCCINCLHILPDLAYLEQKYAYDPVVFIGVHSHKYPNEAVPDNIRQAIVRHRVRHPVVVDAEHAIWNAYGISAWPTLVVIDSQGQVLGLLPGEGHRDELDRLIAALLEQGRVTGTLAEGPVPTRHEVRPPSSSGFLFPGKIAADGAGHRLYIADSGHHRILVTDYHGEVLGFYGSGILGNVDGPYEDARFNNPQGMAFFDGSVFVADTDNHMIRRIDISGAHVDTVLGNGMIGYDRHGGHRGREQTLNSPWDVTFLDGTLYIAMAGLHQIWRYNPLTEVGEAIIGTGRESLRDTVGPKAALAQPSGLSAAQGLLYFADAETSAVRRYDPRTSLVSTLVGKGLFDFGDVDGAGADALLQHPLGVAAQGDLVYVADTYNHKIRVIDPRSGMVRTLIGAGHPGRLDKNLLLLYEPGGLAVAGNDLFIADTNNDRIIHYRLNTGEWREILPKIGGDPLTRAA